jgi:hypothetical protein
LIIEVKLKLFSVDLCGYSTNGYFPIRGAHRVCGGSLSNLIRRV